MSTPASNPTQGGSYIRHPETGALTPLAQPAPPVADLRAEAKPADAPEAAAALATPATAAAVTSAATPDQEA